MPMSIRKREFRLETEFCFCANALEFGGRSSAGWSGGGGHDLLPCAPTLLAYARGQCTAVASSQRRKGEWTRAQSKSVLSHSYFSHIICTYTWIRTQQKQALLLYKTAF